MRCYFLSRGGAGWDILPPDNVGDDDSDNDQARDVSCKNVARAIAASSAPKGRRERGIIYHGANFGADMKHHRPGKSRSAGENHFRTYRSRRAVISLLLISL